MLRKNRHALFDDHSTYKKMMTLILIKKAHHKTIGTEKASTTTVSDSGIQTIPHSPFQFHLVTINCL